SPLTGTVGDCSVGGAMAFQLRRAGWAGIVFTGRSPKPCGLEVRDGKAGLVDATGLLGRDVPEIRSLLRGRGSVAVTGPAADNGVLFASVMVDGAHAAGRNGLGLSFSRKNLKYVSVTGSGAVTVHDPARLERACEQIYRLMASSPVIMGGFGLRNMGTGALYDLVHARGMMPTANFRRTRFDAAPGMNAPALRKLLGASRSGCAGCRILCKKTGSEGVHVPEFETMSHFSALLENDHLPTVVEANAVCNRTGMDTISAGATLACHAEITGRRLSPREIPALLEDIASGRMPSLAQGSRRYAAAEGMPRASMSVKSLELPAYDPRGAYGMALAYAVSTRGGCHLRAYPISHEILRKPVVTDRMSFSGKARIIKIAEDANAAIDSIGACKFCFFGASLEEYAEALSAVTGIETGAHDLLHAGERIYARERQMNTEFGFGREDDDLPARFFEEPGTSTEWMETPPLPRDGFLEALGRYYRIRGLDEGGRLLSGKAAELGLDGDPGAEDPL
ncbi:aldehyde ferredoxin oxidoreductase, partial [Candidatus Fermentibacteria bacterium]|nr:aldehyde ferredoxin oxidoreductase [Candidatus Fermentibacteria bacterium]